MRVTRIVVDEMLFWVSPAFGKQINGQYKEQIQTTYRVQNEDWVQNADWVQNVNWVQKADWVENEDWAGLNWSNTW